MLNQCYALNSINRFTRTVKGTIGELCEPSVNANYTWYILIINTSLLISELLVRGTILDSFYKI